MSKAYEYCPLLKHKKEIRLFRLRSITPATPDHESEILGSIETASLLDKPRYTALSYVWGEPVLSSRILLDDGTYVAITKNLLVALQHVVEVQHGDRMPENSPSQEGGDAVESITEGVKALLTEEPHGNDIEDGLLIWIDAVCINQSDIVEKGWQVAQMADVYSRATRTMIFLGPQSEHSDEAIEFFREIGKDMIPFDNLSGRADFPQRIQNVVSMFLRDDPVLAELHGVDALIASVIRQGEGDRLSVLTNAIMGCAWWFRTWTLQELVLSSAPTFVLGRKRLRHDDLSATLLLFAALRRQLSVMVSTDCERLGRPFTEFLLSEEAGRFTYCGFELFHRRHRPEMAWKLSFTDALYIILSTESNFEATDPRDVIYGFLGLVENWQPEQRRIDPDYSLQCSTVYTRATLALLQNGNVRAFRLAASPKSREDLPSWVPDFSQRTAPAVLAKKPPRKNSVPCYYMEHEGRHILSIQGTFYGRINCNGLRRIAVPGIDDKLLVYQILNLADRELIHVYFSGLVQSLRRRFGSSEELRFQLLMLVSAVALAGSAARPTEDIDPGPGFVAAIQEPRSPEAVSSVASYIRDIIMDPSILDDTSIYDVHDMTPEAKMELEFGGHAKCEESTPLHYKDDPVTLQTLYRAWIHFCEPLFDCEPFDVEGICVGCATREIQDGDVLAKLDFDPNTLYIVRLGEDDLWKLISVTCVPRFWLPEDFPDGESAEFRFC
ncbi:heterokaryon incompatibility protein-domain-containing protein [Phaeosphaeria sp. MPI-PUGE-AT-0046c]|nr:heterokaryon incompatibility protein-domain-containing protein [Phaeosphaeria sp. MPI-PUGE-AT-0046c]